MLLLLVSSSFAQPSPSKAQQIESHTRQAAEYLKNNRADMAASEFRAIVALAPENVDAQSNLGVLLFFSGDFAPAVPHLRAAVKLQPSLSRIQALLGMCEKRNGEWAVAEADLRAAFPKLQDQKLKVQAGLELVEIYYGRDEPEKATEIVAALRTLRPDDPDVLYVAYRFMRRWRVKARWGWRRLRPLPPACNRYWLRNWPARANIRKPSCITVSPQDRTAPDGRPFRTG